MQHFSSIWQMVYEGWIGGNVCTTHSRAHIYFEEIIRLNAENITMTGVMLRKSAIRNTNFIQGKMFHVKQSIWR